MKVFGVELNPPLLLLLALPQQFSNCFEINFQDLKHWDIISFVDVQEDWLTSNDNYGNQISLVVRSQSTSTLSSHLQLMFQDLGSNYNLFDHVISIHNPKSWAEVIADLAQIDEFYKGNFGWKPYFFIRFPEEVQMDSDNKRILANLSLQLPINSNVYFIFEPSFSNSGLLGEIYSLKNLTIVQNVENAFTRTEDFALDFSSVFQKSPRRSNFQRVTITAVAMDSRGYELLVDFDDDNSTGNRLIGGLLIEEYWYLRDALNFTEAAIKGTGYVKLGPGGTLLGLAYQINQGEADLGVSALEFLEFRAAQPDGISYLHPVFHSPMLAFFTQPPASSNRDIFLSTFNSQGWLTLLGLLLSITMSFRLAYRIYSKFLEEMDPVDLTMSKEISLWATAFVCQQSWTSTPSAFGARAIFLVGWLSRILCFAAFSASLVSILSFEVLPIHSFPDLVKEQFSIYNDDHIPTTKLYIAGLQQKGYIPGGSTNVSIENSIGTLSKTRSTIVTLSDSFYPIIRKEGYSDDFACDVLSVVRVGSRPVKMSMFVKKASPLREMFNNKILLMTERGVKSRMMKNYLFRTSVQCLKENNGFRSSQSNKDVYTAYLILVVGFGVALTLVVLERLMRRMNNRDEVEFLQ